MIADITEPLNDDALAVERAFKTGRAHIIGVTEKLTQGILNAAARGFGTPGDAARVQWLAGDTGAGIDVGRIHAAILVGDPGHFARASAHIRGRYILRWVDQVALDQLIGKAASDLFNLMRFPLRRVDDQTAL